MQKINFPKKPHKPPVLFQAGFAQSNSTIMPNYLDTAFIGKTLELEEAAMICAPVQKVKDSMLGVIGLVSPKIRSIKPDGTINGKPILITDRDKIKSALTSEEDKGRGLFNNYYSVINKIFNPCMFPRPRDFLGIQKEITEHLLYRGKGGFVVHVQEEMRVKNKIDKDGNVTDTNVLEPELGHSARILMPEFIYECFDTNGYVYYQTVIPHVNKGADDGYSGINFDKALPNGRSLGVDTLEFKPEEVVYQTEQDIKARVTPIKGSILKCKVPRKSQNNKNSHVSEGKVFDVYYLCLFTNRESGKISPTLKAFEKHILTYNALQDMRMSDYLNHKIPRTIASFNSKQLEYASKISGIDVEALKELADSHNLIVDNLSKDLKENSEDNTSNKNVLIMSDVEVDIKQISPVNNGHDSIRYDEKALQTALYSALMGINEALIEGEGTYAGNIEKRQSEFYNAVLGFYLRMLIPEMSLFIQNLAYEYGLNGAKIDLTYDDQELDFKRKEVISNVLDLYNAQGIDNEDFVNVLKSVDSEVYANVKSVKKYQAEIGGSQSINADTTIKK